MGKAFLVVSSLEQALVDPAQAQAMGESLALICLPSQPGRTSLPCCQASLTVLAKITDAINQKFNILGTSMIVQMSVDAIKAEYAALGMDVNKVQIRLHP